MYDWNNDGKKDVVQADDDTSSGGYYWYKNVGTDSAPVLAAIAKITFGGKSVTYTRPNLGSFVDWDCDGKKDFIGCNFENSVRFYKNIGGGGPNYVPTFAADAEGVTILRDYCIMMISGADVKDWNGDGDLDILTGQGHGGSGLRFFERDYY
ncbi:MAG: FG-GAP-like repeat-containing protein [Armatimonadota bacterium]